MLEPYQDPSDTEECEQGAGTCKTNFTSLDQQQNTIHQSCRSNESQGNLAR